MVTRQERSIGKSKTGKRHIPDFLAKDKNGKLVTFECKGVADINAINCQICLYPPKYLNHKKVRNFLIATYITNDCKKEAKRKGIEVFETDLKFKKVTTKALSDSSYNILERLHFKLDCCILFRASCNFR